MANKTLPTVDELRQLLRADFATGQLFWRPRPAEMFETQTRAAQWNTRFSNKPALTSTMSKGYKIGTIKGQSVLAHRVIWALAAGGWPSGEIDHINGDKTDNRLINLRDVSRQENARNLGRNRNNKSGMSGVHRCQKTGAWKARIGRGGGTVSLGTYNCLARAIRARRQAEEGLGFHANHGKLR